LQAIGENEQDGQKQLNAEEEFAPPAPAAKAAPAAAKAAPAAAKAAAGKAVAAPAAAGKLAAETNKKVPAKEQALRGGVGQYADGLAAIKSIAREHSFTEDLSKLVSVQEESDRKAGALRLSLAQKENALETLEKQVARTKKAIDGDKQAIAALKAESTALGTRVERIKKTRVAEELTAQRNQYQAISKKVSGAAANLQAVSSAIDSKATSFDSDAAALLKAEQAALANAMTAATGGAAGAAQPAAAAAGKPAAAAPAGAKAVAK
jgi:chromosome segregation ATPase